MAEYKAPVRDIQFAMKEVFNLPEQWETMPALAEMVDVDTADAILEEAGKICSEVLAPLNREGDEQGSKWTDGVVTTPEGFKEAAATFAEGGWHGLGGNPEFGGMGMPKALVAAVEEFYQGANMSFGLLPMLNAGAALALDAHGSEELKAKYLPNMYAGVWTGAMDLTEPHAGTDLGIIRTKAEPNDDGSYRVTGTKIFITWGDHDMAENVIHLVLAKLPDAPAGPKGISLFLVPKYLVNEDGSLGEANNTSVGSIEKKMGIKASATCVMNYDAAKGWLVGDLNKGLNAMFTMMNYERLGVGIQGYAAGENSYQSAAEYAKERIQSRAATGPVAPEKAADPIIVHADVRRMLMTMRAYTEGARLFSMYTAQFLDQAKFGEGETKKTAADMVALLTPVAKGFLSDKGLEVTVLGQQCFGGHGFIREWGQEQLVRDVRITQIYEGTNGIQAMDLMGRKVAMNGGEFVNLFLADADAYLAENACEFSAALKEQLAKLKEATDVVLAQLQDGDKNAVGAAAVNYMHLFGFVALAYMWHRAAVVAEAKQDSGDAFYTNKLITARFFYSNLLPESDALLAKIKAGSANTMALADDQF